MALDIRLSVGTLTQSKPKTRKGKAIITIVSDVCTVIIELTTVVTAIIGISFVSIVKIVTAVPIVAFVAVIAVTTIVIAVAVASAVSVASPISVVMAAVVIRVTGFGLWVMIKSEGRFPWQGLIPGFIHDLFYVTGYV